jgi:hypothetical protein
VTACDNKRHKSTTIEEGIAELQELNSGLPRIGKWIIGSLKNVGNRIDLPLMIKQDQALEKTKQNLCQKPSLIVLTKKCVISNPKIILLA